MDSADEDRYEGVTISLEGSGNNQMVAGKWLYTSTRERSLPHYRKRKSTFEVDLSDCLSSVIFCLEQGFDFFHVKNTFMRERTDYNIMF